MKQTAFGALELNSVGRGIESCDAMLKAAEIELVRAMPTCPGKYLIMISGNVAEVRASVEAGRAVAGEYFIDELVIPYIHPDVFPALAACANPGEIDAVGIIETFSMAAAVTAADTACDTANVRLIEIRLGAGLAGKAYVTFTGDVGAVRASVESASRKAKAQNLLVSTAILPAPHPDLKNSL